MVFTAGPAFERRHVSGERLGIEDVEQEQVRGRIALEEVSRGNSALLSTSRCQRMVADGGGAGAQPLDDRSEVRDPGRRSSSPNDPCGEVIPHGAVEPFEAVRRRRVSTAPRSGRLGQTGDRTDVS